MDTYISSGILELYVVGALSENETREVTRLVVEHTELLVEVESIESAFVAYAEQLAPARVEGLFGYKLEMEKFESEHRSQVIDSRTFGEDWRQIMDFASIIAIIVVLNSLG